MTYDLNTEINNVKTEYKAWRKLNKIQYLALHDLLAKNLGIIENINTAYDFNKVDTLLESSKIKVNKKSSIELKVIRLIMVRESKQASVYAKVLKAARGAGINSGGFVKWLKAQGGIEAVRKASKSSINSSRSKQQFEAGKKAALLKKSRATVTLEIPQTQKNDFVLLLARVGDNSQAI